MKDSLISEKKVAQTRGANVFRRLRTIAVSILVIAFCVWLVLEWERTRVSVMGGSADPWYHRIMALFRPAPPFPVIDSGRTVSDTLGGDGAIYWLDNDRVIFNGPKPEGPPPLDEEPEIGSANYVWDTRHNTVRHHADATKGALCISDGYVWMSRRVVEGYVDYTDGSFGRENTRRERVKALEEWRAEQSQGVQQLQGNRFTCRSYDPTRLLPDVPGIKVPLKDWHGALILGGAPNKVIPQSVGGHKSAALAIYIRGSDGEQIDLPIEYWKIDHQVWVPHLNAYLLTGNAVRPSGYDDWPKGQPWPVYLMRLDGGIETINVPYGPWVRQGGHNTRMTAKGLVWGQQIQTGASPMVGKGGAYLFDDDRVVKQIEGKRPPPPPVLIG